MDIAATNTQGNVTDKQRALQKRKQSHSNDLHKRHILTSMVVIGIMLLATMSTIFLLYRTAFEGEQARLEEMVQTHVRMITAVSEFDALYSYNDHAEGAKAATIDQVINAHSDQTTVGKTGEFLLAEMKDDHMVFILPSRHLNDKTIPPVPVSGELAEPMRQALMGKSGIGVHLDYRGEKVVAAYAPLPDMELGLVAKLDLKEIRGPFINAALISLLVVTFITLMAHIPLRRFYKNTTNEHHQLELQLRQSQKLEAVGQLAAGVAHEINTPTQFVGNNVNFLKDACQDLIELCDKYEQLSQLAPTSAELSQLKSEIEHFKKHIDLEFLMEDINAAIDQSIEGTERIANIVKAMKSFSHPGASEKESVDLNQAIENTITVASNEWKYVADIETNLDSHLPLVFCFPGEVNQTVLNIIVNAAHAIEDKQKSTGNYDKGQIKVSTQKQGNEAVITISDTGCGIPEHTIQKIYDPFFTTKAVGKGTGQGLSIAYTVITEKHEGSLSVQSSIGEGSEFEIRLPI